MSSFIKIKVYAERSKWNGYRFSTVLTNEVEELIVQVSRIVAIIPKNEVKCLVEIDTSQGIDTRWCVMSADVVMNLIQSAKEGKPCQ